MRRTTVDIDRHALDAAQVALGTKGVKLREVARSRALADFDIRRDIDGTAAEVRVNRGEASYSASRKERVPEQGSCPTISNHEM